MNPDWDEGYAVFDCPCGFDGTALWRGSGPLIFWVCPDCGVEREGELEAGDPDYWRDE